MKTLLSGLAVAAMSLGVAACQSTGSETRADGVFGGDESAGHGTQELSDAGGRPMDRDLAAGEEDVAGHATMDVDTAGDKGSTPEKLDEAFTEEDVAGHGGLAGMMDTDEDVAATEPEADETEVVDVEEDATVPVAAPVGEPTSCGLYVIATSPDAVGNPCETTASFMASLGLTPEQIVYVQDHGMIEDTAH